MPRTTMTNLSESAGRWVRLLAFSLLAALAGCGPGTGGTGTGPLHGAAHFSGAGMQGASPSGSLCQGSCEVTLALEAQRVELVAGCRRFLHVGEWSIGEDGKAMLEGQVEITTAAGSASVPATLQLQFSEKDANLARAVTAVVTAQDGSLLAGPALLDRGDGPATSAPDCRP
jgi:hypothetical protein